MGECRRQLEEVMKLCGSCGLEVVVEKYWEDVEDCLEEVTDAIQEKSVELELDLERLTNLNKYLKVGEQTQFDA